MNNHNGHQEINQEINSVSTLVPRNRKITTNQLVSVKNFQPSVILQQSPIWSRGIVWGIISLTTGLVLWSLIAKIEEAIPAQGQLETIAMVTEVQAPVGGVVKSVSVKDGDKVKKGDLLLNLEPTVPQSQLNYLTQIRTVLMQENQFYQTQINPSNVVNVIGTEIAQLNLKPQVLFLTKSRATLVAENQLYRAELNGLSRGNYLNFDQKKRLESSQAELNSRVATAQLEVAQFEKQRQENRIKKSSIQQLLKVNTQSVKDIQSAAAYKVSQLEKQIQQNLFKQSSSQEILQINQGILDDINPVAKAGGLPRIQLLKQQQEVSLRQSEVKELYQEQLRLQFQKSEIIANLQVDLSKQKEQINNNQGESKRLDEEYNRLALATQQAQEKLKNTTSLSKKDLWAKITTNEQRIAEIDTQLTKSILENQKRLSEINSQISQSQLTLQYQNLRSPVNGTVFQLKAEPGFVANVANSNQPLLKIVPDDNLMAKVYITNKDIGFIKEGMDVDVRIDSFPFSEFGDIKGKLSWIGSDSLPPDQIHQFYRFPATIKLEKQFLYIHGRQVILQSGMSINANIKIRTRTIMSIFTDLFTQKMDDLKFIR